MMRNGIVVLGGTLLFSVLLTPGARSVRANQGSSATSGERPIIVQETSPAGGAKQSPTSKKHPKKPSTAGAAKSCGTGSDLTTRKGIEDDARCQYLHDFYDLIADACRRGESSTGDALSACQLDTRNFIIALEPDPLHTHLALTFDRRLDVIEEALQDNQYLFERALMPWDEKTHPESDDHTEREQAKWAQDARETEPGLMVFRHASDEHPVWDTPPPPSEATNRSPLFVLVVGESPTAGIHKTQFQNALARMQYLLNRTEGSPFDSFRATSQPWPARENQATAAKAKQDKAEQATAKQDTAKQDTAKQDTAKQDTKVVETPGLRIFGPTFSGSLSSLADLLECPGPAKPQAKTATQAGSAAATQPAGIEKRNSDCFTEVSIHSGSIESSSAMQQFLAREVSRKVYFVSFQESDKVVVERFVQFMAGEAYGKRYYDPERIVILSEDETAYGSQTPNFAPRTSGPHEAATNEEFCSPCVAHPTPQDQPVTIYFPREISQLRSAYQQDVIQANASGGSGPRDVLPSYADVPGADDDTVPNYAQRQLPLSQEAVMLGIISELKKHEAQYILVRATDHMDMLFLIRYLRAAYPQGRIVTLDADMLFRREAEDPRFHGLLSLSTYSTAPSEAHSFRHYQELHAERIFPDTSDIGSYNAMSSLLRAWVDENSVKACQNASNCRATLTLHEGSGYPRLAQYGWREQWKGGADHHYDAPPVHLLVLGRDQYWPVADLGPYPDEPHGSRLPIVQNQQIHTSSGIKIPASWRVVQLTGLALTIFFCVSVWRASIFSTWQAFAKYAPAVRDRRYYLILVNAFTLIFLLEILIWPAVHSDPTAFRVLEGLLVLALLGVLTIVGFETWSRVWQKRTSCCQYPGESSRRNCWIGLAIFGILVVIILSFGAFLEESCVEQLAAIRSYAMQRSIQLSSGLSFLLPTFFFLTVWLWWAAYSSSNYALSDERRPRLPDKMQNFLVKALCPAALHTMPGGAWPRAGSPWFYLAVLAAVTLPLLTLMGPRHPIMTLERYLPVEAAMSILLLLAIAGVVAVTLRVLDEWGEVRRLLLLLDALPLRNVFKRVDDLSWKLIWNMGSNMAEFLRILARKLETAEHALNTCSRLDGRELKTQLNTTMSLARDSEVLRHGFRFDWREREREIVCEFGKCQCLLAAVAGQALDLLADKWSKEKAESKAQGRASILAPVLPYLENSAAVRQDKQEKQLNLEQRACEDFVCMSYLSFILVKLSRIRSLVVAAGGMYVLTLVGISQYPFEPKGTLEVILVVLLLFVVSAVGIVFAQIHRDTTLSNLANTTPGELGIDFYLKMASFAALPLFSLLAAQFPSINRFIYSWLQPAVEALNH